MFQIRVPLPNQYLNYGHVCVFNQLFGENKNALFYGPEGHTGLDINTTGEWRWDWHFGKRKRNPRSEDERMGLIQVVAAHPGYVDTNFFVSSRERGYSMTVTTDIIQEDEKQVRYRTLYFHIESPWRSLETFVRRIAQNFKREFIREGSVIAIAGNTGKFTTGPHLHLELHRSELVNGQWTPWETIDPLPHLKDDTLYQKFSMSEPLWFFKGQTITREAANKILSNFNDFV